MEPGNNNSLKRKISRRKFISGSAAGSLFLTFTPVSSSFYTTGDQFQWARGASAYRFHMIGHGHIDPVWLWPWEEGVAIVHSTFRSALERMKENPGFCFTTSSAQFFQWIADNDPAMLEEIKQRVKEGRWDIVGGWWVEPDVNIPSGEALVRQGLYGQLTFERLLGKRATVATNPDSFGHTGTLPQIISGQGMENYIFMRPGPREKNIPADLFWWEGPDGTRVLTYRIQQSYNDGGHVRNRLNTIISGAEAQPMKVFMGYYGVGDHGGGATKDTIRSIEEVRAEKGGPEVMFSTAGRYFTEVRNDKGLELPVVKDDLQHHAAGCYTAEWEIKRSNRISEAALVTAEKIAAIGSSVWGFKYPMAELSAAWKRVLFLQFHDSLAGTSLYEHSQTAREGYGFALDTAHQVTLMALQKLEWNVRTEDPASQYLMVFNPHAWEVRSLLEYDLNWGSGNKSSKVENEKGESLPHQWTAGSTETGSRRKLLVYTSLPPMGYRQLRISSSEGFLIKNPVTVSEKSIENEYLKVTFSKDGSVGILDKKRGYEVFKGGETGCRAVVIDDPSDTWSHDVRSFSDDIGQFGEAEFRIMENGPLRATTRIITRYGKSDLTIDWSLTAGSEIVEARVSLNWHERLRMLKFSFPLNAGSNVATCETAYGNIARSTNGDEDPAQRWIDISGMADGKPAGITVMTDAKYGYSARENDLRISVARSAVYAHHNPKVLDMKSEHLWMDQGIQKFRLALIPHKGSWRDAGIVRKAEEFISPPLAIYQGIHGGSMAPSASFIATDNSSVIISSVKRSEKGDDLIVRCTEINGGYEQAAVKLSFAGLNYSCKFRPYEIKTLRINKNGVVTEVNLLEE